MLFKRRLAKNKPKVLRLIEINYSKHYLEKIVKLVEGNNCKIIFLYLPESGSNLKRPLLMDYYKQFSDVRILPDEILKNRSNWKDATHFNDSAAALASDFVSNKISDIK